MPDILSGSLSYAHTPLLDVSLQSPKGNNYDKCLGMTANITAISSPVNQQSVHNDQTAFNAQEGSLGWLSGWLPEGLSGNARVNDAELRVVGDQGRELQRLAEACSQDREGSTISSAAACISGRKMGWLAGATLVAIGTGAFAWGRHPFGTGCTNGTVAAVNKNITKPDFPAEGSSLSLPLPEAAAIFAHRETATEKFQPDDVKVEKLDFLCLEHRQSLTLSAILRQIGNTLSNPVTELAKESQVINYYNKFGRCPNDEAIEKLTDVTLKVDKTVSAILSLIPGMTPVLVMQKVGANLFRILADNLDGSPINQQDAWELNGQLLMLAKTIADFSPRNNKGDVSENNIALPEKIFFKNDRLLINVKGKEFIIASKPGGYVATGHGRNFAVTYSIKKKAWFPVEEIAAMRPLGSGLAGNVNRKNFSHLDIIDREMAAALADVAELDAVRMIRSKPNKNGVYRYRLPGNKKKLRGVKLNGKFYPVRNGAKKGQLAIVGTSDIEIFFYDGKYHLSSKDDSGALAYTPCRLKRSPDNSCINFSEDIDKLLAANHDKGIDPSTVGLLKPDKNNSAILVSTRGRKYIKHHGVLFKVKLRQKMVGRIRMGGVNVHFYSRKRVGFLKIKRKFPIGTGQFSLLRADNFLASEIETTMEAFKFTRATAEAYHSLMEFERTSERITVDESDAIYAYGRNCYDSINGFLLDDMPEEYISPRVRDSFFNAVGNIRSLLKKLPSYKGIVYRGAYYNPGGWDELKEIKVGDIISSKKFISTSIEREVAERFLFPPNDIFYKINVEKAAHPIMLYTGKLNEAEVLIEDSTVFRCKFFNGRNIELEEVINPSHEELERCKYVHI